MRKAYFCSLFLFLSMLTLKGEDEMNLLSKSELKILLPEFVPNFPLILNPFPNNNVSLIQSQDSLEFPTGVIDFSFGQKKIDVHVSWDWSLITITETVDDRKLKIPFTSSLEWYLKIMRQKKWHVSFLEVMQAVKKDDSRRGRGQMLEVVGVDIGRLGRAFLNIRGHVE